MYQSRLIVLSVEPKTNLDIQAGDIIREVSGESLLYYETITIVLHDGLHETMQPPMNLCL